jgi:predicted MFS family arabinose efflux permease
VTRRQMAVLGAATASDVSAVLPVALLGALALRISDDVGMSVHSIGYVIFAFFMTGGVVATVFGGLLDDFGHTRVLVAATVGTALSATLVGLSAGGPVVLVIAVMMAGASLAMAMPVTTAVLRHELPADTLAFAFSVKLCGAPLALGVAGFAVPVAINWIGWRFCYFAVAVLSVGSWAGLHKCRRPAPASTPAPHASNQRSRRGAGQLGLVVFLGSVLVGVLTGFAVISLVGAGITEASAGIVIAVASSGGVLVRLAAGAWVDRTERDSRPAVAVLLFAGSIAAVLMASGVRGLVVAGAASAFTLGWSWTGLAYFLVARRGPSAAAGAASVIQAGAMYGSAAGPMTMSALVASVGNAAWLIVAAASFAGSLLAWSA